MTIIDLSSDDESEDERDGPEPAPQPVAQVGSMPSHGGPATATKPYAGPQPGSGVVDLSNGAESEDDAPREAAHTVDLSSGEDESSSALGFFQLRDHVSDPQRQWALSLEDMLEPAETVTHVLLSTFGHALEQLDELRERLEKACPQLQDVCVISDWRHTDGVGATKAGPTGASQGWTTNPFVWAADDGSSTDERVRCTVVFPALDGDLGERDAQGRGKNSIQHTKLLLLRHAAGCGHPAHLRVHVMSCNVDNVLSKKGKVGDTIWRSPPLEALSSPDPGMVLPSSAAAHRFGHPLFRMLRSMTQHAADVTPPRFAHVAQWADCLSCYNLSAVPEGVSLVYTMPGYYPRRSVSRGAGVLGKLGGRLLCWDYTPDQMARHLLLVLQMAQDPASFNMGALSSSTTLTSSSDQQQENEFCSTYIFNHDPRHGKPLIHIEHEMDNEHDENAIQVCFICWPTDPAESKPLALLKIGRLSKYDAKGLRPLLGSGRVAFSAELHCFARAKPEASSARATSGKLALTGEFARLALTQWYIDISVTPVPPSDNSSVDSNGVSSHDPGLAAWLDLAATLRCSLGIARLGEILDDTGPWPIDERHAFASYSPSFSSNVGWLWQFAAAVEGAHDIEPWSKERVHSTLVELGIAVPSSVGRSGGPTVPQLKQALRDAARAGTTTFGPLPSRLPSIVASPQQVVGMLSAGGPTKAAQSWKGFAKYHEALVETSNGSDGLFNELDHEKPCGVHPRIVAEPHTLFARRLTFSHSKIVVGLFHNAETGSRYGWLSTGSFNLSGTAWGVPFKTGSDTEPDTTQFSSWELGVVLTVPRGTPTAEAQRRMAFDVWPVQFDVHDLAPFGPDEQQAVDDQFAMVPALQARQCGDPNWKALIPTIELRARMEAQEQAREQSQLDQLDQALLMSALEASLHGGIEQVDSGDDADEAVMALALAESVRSEREERAVLQQLEDEEIQEAKRRSLSSIERKHPATAGKVHTPHNVTDLTGDSDDDDVMRLAQLRRFER